MLAAITAATAVVHAGSVIAGDLLGSALPTFWIAVVAALAFFAFAAWTLRGDTLSDAERGKAASTTGSVFAAVFVASCSPSWATVTLATGRTCSEPGSAPPSGWWRRTRWPS